MENEVSNIFSFNNLKKKKNYLRKITQTMIQICRLENIEHKNIVTPGPF